MSIGPTIELCGTPYKNESFPRLLHNVVGVRCVCLRNQRLEQTKLIYRLTTTDERHVIVVVAASVCGGIESVDTSVMCHGSAIEIGIVMLITNLPVPESGTSYTTITIRRGHFNDN